MNVGFCVHYLFFRDPGDDRENYQSKTDHLAATSRAKTPKLQSSNAEKEF